MRKYSYTGLRHALLNIIFGSDDRWVLQGGNLIRSNLHEVIQPYGLNSAFVNQHHASLFKIVHQHHALLSEENEKEKKEREERMFNEFPNTMKNIMGEEK